MMNWVSVEGDEGSVETEPLDSNVLEIDPTRRYVRYNEVLGKGAFKTVYKAFDEVDGIEVAWNQVRIDDVLQSPEDLERLYSEVLLLKSLKHENIIKFYNSWIDDQNKTVNIITELFTSGSLRKYRQKHKKVDMKAVKGWARQILLGLIYLHSHNPPIVHRDLKCDNIFVNGNHGEVKIGDLGLATVMQQANAHSFIGTPEFMAPELYEEDYNELVDIYSFGMCLLEIVTFEYPYCECRNPAQIFRKVSSGIKPASLGKLEDPEVKIFIEKCLAPAAERLPAKELLKDPFLQLDSRIPNSLLLPDIVMPKSGAAFGDRCVLSEASGVVHPVPLSMDIDGEDNEPVVTIIEKSSGGDLPIPSFEAQRSSNGNELRIKGEKIENNSVSLILRIADQNGRVRNIHFIFYLDSDTALSVAGEMVEQLELSDQNITFIAELIDLLLINLIPGWKPSVPVDQLATLDQIEASEDQHKCADLPEKTESPEEYSWAVTLESGSSIQNILESVDISSPLPCVDCSSMEGSVRPICENNIYPKLDEIMGLASYESQVLTGGEDQGSVISFVSSVSTDVNDKKCSGACNCLTSGYVDYNDYELKREVGDQKDTGSNMGVSICLDRNMPSFSDFPSNASSFVSAEDEADDELRSELELIELQYQQALMELCKKREEAITAAKKRSLQKNLPVH